MGNLKEETKEFHSTYKGHDIVKVTQASGRVTYDVYSSSGRSMFDLVELGLSSLSVARATITAIKND